MTYPTFKNLKKSIPLFAAVNCTNLGAELASGEPPSILEMMCVVGRVFNLFLMVVGIAFVIIIGYGTWKSSLALGDPKGLDGAKKTWTYAVIGFFVVLFAFSIFSIILSSLGLPIVTPQSILEDINGAILTFLRSADMIK